MKIKDACCEIQDLAKVIATLPEGEDLSSQLLVASRQLVGQEEDPKSPEDDAREFIEATLEVIGKRGAWWLSPHNLVLNEAVTQYNFWYFTILPMFPTKTAYRDDLKGIVIHPIWRPVDHPGFRDLDMVKAKQAWSAMQQANTIQEDIRKELTWIESKFSIRIPDAVQAKILKEAMAMANRRWGVNRLRVKNRLIPLDGSPPKDLGSME